MGKQVKQRRREGPNAQTGHHVAQLADGRVGHHAFDVVHHQAHGGRHEGGERANQGHHRQRFG